MRAITNNATEFVKKIKQTPKVYTFYSCHCPENTSVRLKIEYFQKNKKKVLGQTKFWFQQPILLIS